MSDLSTLDAVGQAEAVRRDDVTPVELVDAAIERIEKLNVELNAVIHERFEQARREAEEAPAGPFRGVPFVHKDLDGYTAGDPYHAGGRFLRDAGYSAEHDSHLCAGLRAAGFVLVGKTNTPELGLQPTTEPESCGPTRNPWDTGHSTGGSSGGSAAAVASGMVPVGHAGDGGGSIRIPASECGLVGLKPSRGRVSLGPDEAESWGGLVVRMAVTRSVRDTAGVLDAISGPMPGDPYAAPPPARPYALEVGSDPGALRVGVLAHVPSGTANVHPDCVAAAEATGRLLESAGHAVEPAHPAALGEDLTGAFISFWAPFTTADLDRWAAMAGRAVGPDDVEAGTWTLAEMGRGVNAAQYLAAGEWLGGWGRRVRAWWEDDGFDLLVTPTLAEPPPRLGQFSATPDDPLRGFRRSAELVPFTVSFNVTGQPAVSLPLHWNDAGLPIGSQLVAAYGREDVLIRVASQLEEAQPWADRRPPVSA